MGEGDPVEELVRAIAALIGEDGAARFGVAVSCGPDSMALMVLAAEWRARSKSPAPSISVATVDHGLRSEARFEAEQVGAAQNAWRNRAP